MTLDDVIERVGRIARTRGAPSAGRRDIEAALADEAAVRAWLDAANAALVTQLRAHTAFVESSVADAGRTSLNAAAATTERATTLDRADAFAAALDDARITAAHVDELTKASKRLDDAQQRELFDRCGELADVASVATVDEFRRRLGREVASIRTDDGETRLRRQQADTRLSTWTDHEGMWNLRARFDPVTGLKLSARLDHAMQALFAEAVPDHCPTDGVEKQKFLAAHALARLVDESGSGARAGRAEFVAVIDADAPGGRGPTVDWPIPVEIPARVLAQLTGDADVHGVVIRNGVILHAPGDLDLGRATRLANRAQRRALRALYRGCAIPGCAVRYDRCKLHHLVWWRNGGRTDLANLIPVCAQHHAHIHRDGWVITLGPQRELTLCLPDGTIRNTGPPTIRAA